jgi:hypothetical protein
MDVVDYEGADIEEMDKGPGSYFGPDTGDFFGVIGTNRKINKC